MRSWKEFVVGLTVLLGLAGVATLLLLFGEFSGVSQRSYPMTLVMADASGLTRASAVTLNGVSIGTISNISIASGNDPRQGVRIELRVNEGVRVPRDIEVTLERSFVGESSLSLATRPLEPGGADPGYVAPGDSLSVETKGLLDSIASIFDERISEFAGAAKSIQDLSASLTQASQRAADLLEPRSTESVDAGTAPANIPSTLARLDEAVKNANVWLGDEGLQQDAKAIAKRVTEVVDQASGAIEGWTTAARTLSDNTDRLGNEGAAAFLQFAQTTTALNETILEVQTLLARVNKGEGTAGQLVTNPDLYNSINDAAVRLDKALTEAQLLFEKYRKDGIPLRF